MKYLGIFALTLSLVACKAKSSQETATDKLVEEVSTQGEENKSLDEYSYGNQPMKIRGAQYICQTGRPGLSVEYLQIALNETGTGIEGMWYFNSRMEEPVRQIIHEQVYDLEKEILTGKYSYPEAKEVMTFVLKGKRFTSKSDDMTDHYDLEE